MGKKRVILLADDNRDVRKILTAILEYEGYEVISTLDGLEACNLLRQKAKEFCLVLTDLEMPLATGKDVLQTAKKHDPELPVIVMSGLFTGDSGLEAELASLGAAATMLKSVKASKYIDLVKQCARR